jgi:hypothetical protein
VSGKTMKIIRPEAELLSFGTVDDGKKLLINSVIDGISNDLITITADDNDESLWFEIVVENNIVQIPFELVKRAIERAPDDVHSETWYEKNIYNDSST